MHGFMDLIWIYGIIFGFMDLCIYGCTDACMHGFIDQYRLMDSDALRGQHTFKYGDAHEKFNFLKIQDLRPWNTCQKHFEMILLIFH